MSDSEQNIIKKESHIDFFLVDSMDIIDYEPIHRHLTNSRIIAVPGSVWFDFDRAVEYIQQRNLEFQTTPSINPVCVITTQYHREIKLLQYKKSITMRLIYSLTEKNFCHSKKASVPFDVVLVPGPYSKELISKYTNAIIVGLPKYDDFFNGVYRKPDLQQEFKLNEAKKTILYLPTWAKHSSLDLYKKAIKKLANTNEYNILLKPHTVTVRKERQRINYFKRQIKKDKIHCLEQQIGLDKLFTVADIVIADAMSGAFWESIFIANLPTLAIHSKGKFQKKNLETRVQEFAIINNNPNLLEEDLKRVENEPADFKKKRNEWADNLISFRDGTAGKRAADVIRKFIESK